MKRETVPLLLLAAMFAVAWWMWSRVPTIMPVHWDWDGLPDRFGGRFEGLFVLPLAAVAIYLVTLAIPYIDPRRARFVQFADTYRVIRTLVVATMLGLELLHVTWIRHSGLGSVGLPAMYGVMFVALGIYLPKVQSNFFVGVRTPWTLSSEESWRRTHKLAGWLFGIGGVVTTAIAIVAPEAGMPAMFTTLGVAAITSIVYSYLVWRTAADRTEAGKI